MSNNFNLVAPLYDRLADLAYGGDIQLAQEEFLNELPEEGKVLFIGGGSGQTLKKVLKLKPKLKVLYLEASSRMLKISEKLISKEEAERVEFQLGTENQIPVHYQFDALLTFFFLDLFRDERKQRIVNKLNGHLKSGGTWLHADFLPAKGFFAQVKEKVMFLFFKLFSRIEANSIHEDGSLFKAAGLKEIKSKLFHKKQIFSTVFKKQ